MDWSSFTLNYRRKLNHKLIYPFEKRGISEASAEDEPERTKNMSVRGKLTKDEALVGDEENLLSEAPGGGDELGDDDEHVEGDDVPELEPVMGLVRSITRRRSWRRGSTCV